MSVKNLQNNLVQDYARNLQNEILESSYQERLPNISELKTVIDEWLPSDLVVCRSKVKCLDACQFHQRCESSYWLNHTEKVSNLMADFARLNNLDEELYYITGYAHDLDYLQFPHDLENVSLKDSHPFKCIEFLREINAPRLMLLAILEHSPHLNLKLSSALSKALLICDDISTFSSANLKLEYPNTLPSSWIDLFKNIPPDKETLVDPKLSMARFYGRVVPCLESLAIDLS